MSVDPLYSADGEHAGFVVEADDDETYATDTAGNIAAVWNGAEWVDVEPGFGYVELEPEPDPRAVALDERLARIEELAATPRAPVYQEVVVDAAMTPQTAGRIARSDVDRIERLMGRKLTRDELHAGMTRLAEDLDNGRPIDLGGALDRAVDEGERVLDLDDPHDRREYYGRRFADIEADERGDELGSPAPAQRESYNLDNRDERLQWQADAMRGVADSSMTYTNADIREDWEQ